MNNLNVVFIKGKTLKKMRKITPSKLITLFDFYYKHVFDVKGILGWTTKKKHFRCLPLMDEVKQQINLNWYKCMKMPEGLFPMGRLTQSWFWSKPYCLKMLNQLKRRKM